MAYENNPESVTDPADVGSGRGVQHVEVSVDDAGTRLDNFLVRHLKDVPRTHVFRLLRKGEVRVNKKRARPEQRVVLGDIVRIPPVRRAEDLTPPVIEGHDHRRWGWVVRAPREDECGSENRQHPGSISE